MYCTPMSPETGKLHTYANMQVQDCQKSSYLYEIWTERLQNSNVIFLKKNLHIFRLNYFQISFFSSPNLHVCVTSHNLGDMGSEMLQVYLKRRYMIVQCVYGIPEVTDRLLGENAWLVVVFSLFRQPRGSMSCSGITQITPQQPYHLNNV